MHETPGSPRLDGSDAADFSHRTANAALGNMRQTMPTDMELIKLLFGLTVLLLRIPFRLARWGWRIYREARQRPVRDYND